MILAAEYIPSPLHWQLMLVTQEIGFPIPPVSRFTFGNLKRGVPVSRFAGIGKRAGNREPPFPDSAGTGNRGPDSASRGFPGLLPTVPRR